MSSYYREPDRRSAKSQRDKEYARKRRGILFGHQRVVDRPLTEKEEGLRRVGRIRQMTDSDRRRLKRLDDEYKGGEAAFNEKWDKIESERKERKGRGGQSSSRGGRKPTQGTYVVEGKRKRYHKEGTFRGDAAYHAKKAQKSKEREARKAAYKKSRRDKQSARARDQVQRRIDRTKAETGFAFDSLQGEPEWMGRWKKARKQGVPFDVFRRSGEFTGGDDWITGLREKADNYVQSKNLGDAFDWKSMEDTNQPNGGAGMGMNRQQPEDNRHPSSGGMGRGGRGGSARRR